MSAQKKMQLQPIGASDSSLRLKFAVCFPAIRSFHYIWRPAMRRVLFLLVALSVPAILNAEVTRVEIASRADVLNGTAYGNTGAYEQLIGRIFFSIDPAN